LRVRFDDERLVCDAGVMLVATVASVEGGLGVEVELLEGLAGGELGES